nr:hypothetical protein [Tanacetum cinerariifolium]
MAEQQTIKYASQWTDMSVDNVIFKTNNVVLDGNYSFTEQVNSIQQLLAYSLITRTEVDIEEIIYSDLVTKLLNKSRLKYVLYPRFIFFALQVLLGFEYTQDKKIRDSVSLPPLVAKPKKGKSQTVAPTLPMSQDPEASGALSKKRTKPKSKRPPTKTKESPPKPTEGLPSTLNEDTRKSQPLPESTVTPPKDSGGNDQPIDRDLTFTTSDEGTNKTTSRPEGSRNGAKYQEDQTQSSRFRYQSLTKNKGEPSYERELDNQPMLLTYANVRAILLSEDEAQESDEEVFAAGDDMDEDPQDDKEVRTLSPKQDQPAPSHVQESASDSSSPDLKIFDNILPLTERQLIRGAAGYGGAQNRFGNANPGQARQIKQDVVNANSRDGVALDEEQLLFLACRQDNAIDEDVDEQPVQDLALNMDNVFHADDCDTFDSDVDEAPTAQTMFMANLSSADPIYDEASLSYDLDILSEVYDHDHYQDVVCEHHEEHEMHDNIQLNHVVDSHADYMSNSNMILYDQYVKDNAMLGVKSNVSSVPNDAYMMIYNDMYEPHA